LPPAITIRPGTTADLPAIVAMRDRLNELERQGCAHASIIPMSLEQFTAMWSGTFSSPHHCWRIVEQDGQPVGFALIYVSIPRTTPAGAYLHWAYLEPTVRRGGVGQQLFTALRDWAATQGVNRIELQYIEGNGTAERFWKKMGFRSYATRCVQYL
jgi:GNAT superfamily N-acetyltransferase